MENRVEHLAKVLRENSLTLYTNRRKYVPQRGSARATTQLITSPRPKTYPSRAAALAASNGIRLGLRDPGVTKGQTLVIVGKDREKSFKGKLAYNRLCYIPVERFGTSLPAVEWYLNQTSLLVVVDSSTYAKWLHSGSTAGSRVPPSWWERRAMTDQFINLNGHMSLARAQRFYFCVLNLHTELYTVCKAFEKTYPSEIRQFSLIVQCLIKSILDEGRCESSLVQVFKDAVEVVHRDDVRNDLERTIRSWPGPLRVTLFRIRRSIFSDEWNVRNLQKQAVARLQQPPLVLTPRGEMMMKRWQDLFRAWIGRNPSAVEDAKLIDFHKSSASFLSVRAEGGGSRELHLVTGLYRLSQGRSSTLADVFEQVSSKDTIHTLLEKYHRIDVDEAIQACVWWCGLIESKGWPLGFMISIFPEREPKGRTFTVPWAAPEMLSSPAVKLVKMFLQEQPETARALTGSNQQYGRFLKKSSGPDTVRVDSDSSCATDYYGESLVDAFYQPAFEVLPEHVKVGVHLSKKRGLIALAEKRARVLDELSELLWSPSKLVRLDPERPIGAYPPSSRVLSRYKGTRKIRITDSEELIRAAAREGPFILKAFTGAGKTTWLAWQENVVISLPTIAQCVMLAQSLESADIPHCCYWSGLTRPDKKFKRAIICTPSHVHSLLKENAARWYVCDEADVPMDSPLVAINACLKAGRFFIACSATPDALRLPVPTLEILGDRLFPVEKRTCREADLASEIRKILKEDSDEAMVVVHSEPKALALERQLQAEGLNARALLACHDDKTIVEVLSSPVKVTTNKTRSSMTLPNLTAVFDFQRRYQYITDPLTGIITGVITRTSQADEDQLEGRVGRVKPGIAVQVENNIPCAEPITAIHDVEESARLIRELDPGLLALPYSAGSIERHVRTTALCCKYLDANMFSRGLPAPIRLLKKAELLEGMRNLLGLMYCFEAFGFKQRLLELSRTNDPELSLIQTQFTRDVIGSDFSRAYAEVFITFINHGLYHRETSMTCRWLGIEHSERGIRRNLSDIPLWESAKARTVLVTLMWDSVVTAEGNEYSGVLSRFRSPRNAGDPQNALLLARQVDMTTGTITYLRALPLKREVDFIREMNQLVEEEADYSVSRENSVSTYAILAKSQHRPYLTVASQPPAPLMVAQPTQLPKLLEAIGGAIDDVAYAYEETTSGVNMASRISPRLLLGLCWIAGLEAQKAFPDLLFEVFGDDFAGAATDDPKKPSLLGHVSELRGEFGMKVKPSASAEQRNPDSLTVLTERFSDGRGQEVKGIKPSSFVKLFLSQNPRWSMLYADLERTDYIGDYNALKNLFPESLSALRLSDPSESRQRRKRVTHSRLLARQLLGAEMKTDCKSLGTARPHQVEGLVTEIEELILLLSPSTRGQGKVTESVGLASTVQDCPQKTLTRLRTLLNGPG